MKNSKIIFSIFTLLITLFLISSCEKDDITEVVTPEINPGQTVFSVDYTAGEVSIDLNANSIFFATVAKVDEDWLSYKFDNGCTTLIVSFLENDTTVERTGQITMSKGDVTELLSFTQAGNPNANNGKSQKLDLEYAVNSGGGYTIFSVTEQECDKIPIGATVVIECGDAGTISLLDASYSEYVGGGPVNGIFSFVWTQKIANITAAGGITTGILRDGFEINAVYAIYTKSNLEYSINTQGGYTILSVPAEECAKIPIGANVIFECPNDVGTVSLLDASYSEFAGGSPVNGKFSFGWTSSIAEITGSAGITTGILRDGFDISNMYFTSVITDLEYAINTGGGYTIFSVSVEECAKIPIGATVVLECPSDAGTISLLDASYSEFAGGSPINGEFSFVWTKEIASITATSGITTGILRDGFDVSAMYCHN